MAKYSKPAVKKATDLRKPRLSSKDDYRKALIRLVRRQLDCARRGVIGSEAWKTAFSHDVRMIDRYALIAGIEAPVIELVVPADDEPPEIHGWLIRECADMPSDFPTKPPTRHLHHIPPDELDAVNLIAIHVLADWIERAEHNQAAGKSHGEFMPAAWFKGVRINGTTLRSWAKRGKIQTQGSSRARLYHAETAFVLRRIHPLDGWQRCREEWAKRHDSGKA